jgi:hypothetical protein
MQHDGTTNTMTHDGESWRASEHREPAAKARADVVSDEIIAAAIEVRRQLGPGLLDSIHATGASSCSSWLRAAPTQTKLAA